MPERMTPAEHALRGSKGNPERTVGYVVPVAKPPRAPAGLGDAGRELWRSAWRAAHWLTPLDLMIVEIAAHSADAIARLDEQIAAGGSVAAGYKGQPVPHPLVKIRDARARQLRTYLGDLGLTPVGRRRLGIGTRPAAPVEDATERFLRGRAVAGQR